MPHLTSDQTTMLLVAIGLLCALTAVGLVFAIVALIGTRRRLSQGLGRILEELAASQQALAVQASLIEQLESRSKAQEIGAVGDKAIDVAVRLARTGASSDQLAANSGLTRQEARLLARIHGPDKARAQVGA